MSDDIVIRMNVSIRKKFKEEWEKFADNEGISISELIRLSTNEYIKQKKRESNPPIATGDSLSKIEKQLESKLEEKMNSFSEMFKKLVPSLEINEEKKDQLKVQITSILEDHKEGFEPKRLAQYCGIDRRTMSDLIAELQGIGIVEVKKGLVFLVK